MGSHEERRVRIRVISQTGTCEAGHKVGDEFVATSMCPEHLCAWAFNTIFPYLQVLMCDGSFPWENDPQKCTVACGDPSNPVIFELSREKWGVLHTG